MKTFKEVVAALAAVLHAHPEYADLPCVVTDDQCRHEAVDGRVYVEDSGDWPDEYGLQDDVTGAFVRIT